ncbi:hypothetical protein FRAAL3994 [Frankia alni ACN14a]|uniref:Uncharacterized protein n=1 Tax=Frankia alni (strain DSM 45986 / CECT 9034 / ACN14a) TaxID=326424 RepID=Q0RIN2_FRAAA|nr:hypothetical protein FRAAL3994 [Frankia alni ACN14a]
MSGVPVVDVTQRSGIVQGRFAFGFTV